MYHSVVCFSELCLNLASQLRATCHGLAVAASVAVSASVAEAVSASEAGQGCGGGLLRLESTAVVRCFVGCYYLLEACRVSLGEPLIVYGPDHVCSSSPPCLASLLLVKSWLFGERALGSQATGSGTRTL